MLSYLRDSSEALWPKSVHLIGPDRNISTTVVFFTDINSEQHESQDFSSSNTMRLMVLSKIFPYLCLTGMNRIFH